MVNSFLERVVYILLILWAVWITHKTGMKLEDATTAIKTFNANLGPKLPVKNEANNLQKLPKTN